jgi:Mn2+/Fe2+ NRAMP family transporter
LKSPFKSIGPGIVVAATGIGAGDMIAASVGGSSFGYGILWAVVLGGILKFVLNEGIGRWQLVTGLKVTEAWVNILPKYFAWYFIIYLVFWSYIVAAALIAATGLAAHSLWPVLSVNQWGILHSVLALIFVLWGSYKYFETVMKIMIALLFSVVIVSVIIINPDLQGVISGLFIPRIPEGSTGYLLAIMGGVGGSVTLLSYGYWIAEKKWTGAGNLKRVRIDLIVAYTLTAIFGISIAIISANLKPDAVKSNQIIIVLANEMELITGKAGSWIFLIGFWGAVFSSMLGVWQGIPYLFADFAINWRKESIVPDNLHKTKYYRYFLVFLAIPPVIILYFNKPVWLILVYSVIGAFFMPFLAISLLWLNNKKDLIGKYRNSWLINVLLVIILALFAFLAYNELNRVF